MDDHFDSYLKNEEGNPVFLTFRDFLDEDETKLLKLAAMVYNVFRKGVDKYDELFLLHKLATLLDANSPRPIPENIDIGMRAYVGFGHARHWLDKDRKPMPSWEQLNWAEKQAWRAAAKEVFYS